MLDPRQRTKASVPEGRISAAVAQSLLQRGLGCDRLKDVEGGSPGATVVAMGGRLHKSLAARTTRGFGGEAVGNPLGRPTPSHRDQVKRSSPLPFSFGAEPPQEEEQGH